MNLEILAFEETPIRIAMKDGAPWFCASDVARVLTIEKVRNVVGLFPDDEKGAHTVGTLGGDQETLFISEPGLYRLIFKSRKPEAEKFRHWVFHEVLPAIRKTGRFSVAAVPAPRPVPAPVVGGVGLFDYVRAAKLDYAVALKLAVEVRKAARALGARKARFGAETFDPALIQWVQATLPRPVLTLAESLSADLRALIADWIEAGNPKRNFVSLCNSARRLNIFREWIGDNFELSPAGKASFGRYLLSQNGAVLDGFTFDVIGHNRQRHYRLTQKGSNL